MDAQRRRPIPLPFLGESVSCGRSVRRATMPLVPVSMPTATSQPIEATRTDEETDEIVVPDLPWVTVVWNDPINLMSYVSYVFRTYFGYPREKANKLMMDVHTLGKAVVSSGTREEMETDAGAMHGFGLWATVQKSGD
jgi:ATP-dependent Clp protease adaptor protein ClpS